VQLPFGSGNPPQEIGDDRRGNGVRLHPIAGAGVADQIPSNNRSQADGNLDSNLLDTSLLDRTEVGHAGNSHRVSGLLFRTPEGL
jgi:hypothetical protein